MLKVLEEREKEIADGLNAASEGRRELEEANVKKDEILVRAKKEAADLVKQASQRANQLVEEAKTKEIGKGRFDYNQGTEDF